MDLRLYAIPGSHPCATVEAALDLKGLEPEPPLFPRDPEQAKAVADAERWGDKSLQTPTRCVIAVALTRNGAAGDTFLAEANVPSLPAALSARMTSAIFGLELRLLAGGLDGGRKALEKLPGLLDKVDALIEEGVIGGEHSNAADLQIAGSVRLLLTLADLREAIDARPAGKLARRLIPRYPGEVPAGALPPEWIPSLDARAPAPAATG